MKIPNCEKFNLSAQTSAALRRTLRCHSLIEDLLAEGYQYVLTARFQSDPLERRYGQYRQMSGGRFLVSLKDVLNSEKILKIKSLIKEGFDVDDNMKVTDELTLDLELFENSVEDVINDIDKIMLKDESREISDHIAGYAAKKLSYFCDNCCDNLLFDRNSVGSNYHQLLSRGGLQIASLAFSSYVATGFAVLDACSDAIRKSDLTSRLAGEYILKKVLLSNNGFTCASHEAIISCHAIRIISNVFFNNQRKRTTETVVNDRVAAFKKSKRTK